MTRSMHRLTLALLAAGALAGALFALAPEALRGQDLDAEALRIERRLLCPQCVNLRLDVCDTTTCRDMRAEIRQRLAAGWTDDAIIESFTERYGDYILADVPRSGFNRWLFAWVGASVVLVAGIGALVLVRMRRSATPAAATSADDRWLDEQLARDPSAPRADGR